MIIFTLMPCPGEKKTDDVRRLKSEFYEKNS